MQNNIISFIVIVIISGLALLFCPWWISTIISFFTCIFMDIKGLRSFIIPFLAIFLLWFLLAAKMNIANDHIMGNIIANMFGMANSWAVITFGALVAALVSAMAGYCGGLTLSLKNKA